MKWNYVDTDGNPKKEGVYWATIIYRGWDREKQKPNDDKYVMIDTRYFCNAKEKEPAAQNGNGRPCFSVDDPFCNASTDVYHLHQLYVQGCFW
jgi:hypothetical protein